MQEQAGTPQKKLKYMDGLKGLQVAGAMATDAAQGRFQQVDAKAFFEPRIEIFTGNQDGNAADSWCPDCKRNVPVILEIALAGPWPVHVIGVGERDDWKGKDNPFRKKAGLKLERVPTMRLVSGGRELARSGPELEDDDVDKVRSAVKGLLAMQFLDTQSYFSLPPADDLRVEVFTGNTDGSASDSWCPDCQRAVPLILAAVLPSTLKILSVGVGDRDDWKLDARGNDNPFRAQDGLRLTGVPTMRLVRGTCEMARLGTELEHGDVGRVQNTLKGLLAVQFCSPDVFRKMKLKTLPKLRIEIFTGNKDGNTRDSWCPDCRRAVPLILAAALWRSQPIFCVGVGERDAWKSPDNIFKTDEMREGDLWIHKGVKLTCVPTVRIMNGQVEVARLSSELEEEDMDKVRPAIAALLDKLPNE